MPRIMTLILTCITMTAFAGNSLLCRLALTDTSIDAASFTTIRIVSGALALWLILRLRGGVPREKGTWLSALMLFCYAAGFSYAYISLPAGIGALLLCGTVQATMIGYGLWSGERFSRIQTMGLICALGGLLGLLLPGASAPPPLGSALMLATGAAWGVYCLRGRSAGDPTSVTTGNFLRATLLALGMSLVALPWQSLDRAGICYAIASGALTSGMGYAVWYMALRGLTATSAATVQLSVPIITALGGVLLLGETVTLRLLITSVAILGGIALVIIDKRPVDQICKSI
jgi:drug/metabolite transporter (DMT)-like permease